MNQGLSAIHKKVPESRIFPIFYFKIWICCFSYKFRNLITFCPKESSACLLVLNLMDDIFNQKNLKSRYFKYILYRTKCNSQQSQPKIVKNLNNQLQWYKWLIYNFKNFNSHLFLFLIQELCLQNILFRSNFVQ